MTYSRNIPRFYLYKALRFPLVWVPVYVIFFQDARGLSLAQIGVIDAVFWLSSAVGEVPTGAIADRFGRKRSMLLGVALYTVAISMVAVAGSFALIVVAFIGWGIALTLTSGADEALLYESLKADGRAQEYTRVFSRVEIIQISARSIGSVAGGLLAGIALALPYYVSAVLGALTFLVVLSLREPPPAVTVLPYHEIMRESLRLVRWHPLVRWALVYLAVIPLAPFIIAFVYIQPYALAVGLDVTALGVLVMLVNVAGVVGVALAPRLTRRFGEVPVLLAVPPLLLAGLAGLTAITAWPGLILMGGVALVNAVIRPVVMTIVQREVSDPVRATIVSLGSLAFTLMLAIFSPVYGWLADTYGLSAVFALMAITLALSLVGLLALRHPRTPVTT